MAGTQAEAIAFLCNPANWRGGGPEVDRIDTHGAMVFLCGDRVLKMKRAVDFAWMDFSTVGKRAQACRAEVDLNRRTAPMIYMGLRWLTRAARGGLELDGPGEQVEPLVEMRRFPQENLLDHVAAGGRLGNAVAERLADAVAGFHLGAERRPDMGPVSQHREVIETAALQFRTYGKFLDQEKVETLRDRLIMELQRVGGVIEARRGAGYVRHCHGDLHLRNIVLIDGLPVLFDCIDFNPAFAEIDVFYDLAFLIMDLVHRRLPVQGNIVLSRYLAHTGDMEGLRPLPLFLACRAAIRGHVAALTSTKVDDAALKEGHRADATAYLDRALAMLEPARPRLVAVGGLSGSGKTTVARAIAPMLDASPGAVVLRSDEIRKCLSGVAPSEKLGPEGYTAEAGQRTYDALRDRASRALAAGRSVIVDAVNAKPEERDALAGLAHRAGVSFDGIWLDAPRAVLAGRVEERVGDASDADVDVLNRQLDYDLGPMNWRRIDAGAGTVQVISVVSALLGRKGV